MKKHLLKASIFTGLSLAISGLFVAIKKFKKSHPMKPEDYTKYALYMAVLDDAIVRKELGEANEAGEVEVHFPDRMETLHHRYSLFLEMNKGKTEEALEKEISEMEKRLQATEPEA